MSMDPNSIEPLPARPRQAFGRARHLRGGGGEVKVAIQGECVEYQGNLGQDDKSFTDVVNYEYLDHTADVQFHSWGKTKEEAFEQVKFNTSLLLLTSLLLPASPFSPPSPHLLPSQAVVCMFSYITDLPTVELRASNTVEVGAGRETCEKSMTGR